MGVCDTMCGDVHTQCLEVSEITLVLRPWPKMGTCALFAIEGCGEDFPLLLRTNSNRSGFSSREDYMFFL